jgi:crotonobetainyl-CoA:carnitine CoA-transferase CaiB-like acyl-CoA transferase
MANPVKFSKMKETTRKPAPVFDQNTGEVLLEPGYSEAEILKLKDLNVIA